jgi:hypothetical protein
MAEPPVRLVAVPATYAAVILLFLLLLLASAELVTVLVLVRNWFVSTIRNMITSTKKKHKTATCLEVLFMDFLSTRICKFMDDGVQSVRWQTPLSG